MLDLRNIKKQMRAYLFSHAAVFVNVLAKGDQWAQSLGQAGGQETTITRLGVQLTN
jgi:hypothetical protein